jgi:septum formation protein
MSSDATLLRAAGVPPLVLASGSPRRAELLRQIGIAFEVRLPAEPVDETPRDAEVPADYVLRLAVEKAAAVARGLPERVVLAADTTVVLDGRILGKPADRAEAVAMLLALQGRAHEVLTGIAVQRADAVRSALSRTLVRFRAIERAEAEAYWETGEGADKAGGYGIQGIGAIFAETLQGSYSNVVGLPLAETERLLRELGVDTWAMRRGA